MHKFWKQALFLALAVALPFYVVPPADLFFELVLKSDQPGATLLSYSQKRGFNDDDVTATALRAELTPSTYRLPLPGGAYRAFRINFITEGANISIDAARVVDSAGRLIEQLPLALFRPNEQITLKSAPGKTPLEFHAHSGDTANLELSFDNRLPLSGGNHLPKRTLYALLTATCIFLITCLAGAVGWLNSERFSRYHRHWPWLTLVVAALVLVARMPDRFLHPQFYAEDGYFYACARELGASTLLMPYGGYLLTVDRLIAAVGVHLPALYVPFFFNLTAFAIALLVLSRIFSKRINLPFRPLLALAVVLIPRPQDIFLTITNIQWVLSLALVLLVISADAGTWRQRIYDYTMAVLGGLTGVYSILLFPFFLWRAIRRKTRESAILLILIGIAATVQACLVITTPHTAAASIPADPFVTTTRIIGLRQVCLLFGGPWLVHPRGYLLTIIGCFAIAWMFFVFINRQSRNREPSSRWLLAAILFVFAAAALFRFKGMLPLFLSAGYSRYFFISQLLFIWLLIFELHAGKIRRVMAGVALYAFIVTTLCTFRLEPFVDYHWSRYVPALENGQSVWMPINPPGWRCFCPEPKK